MSRILVVEDEAHLAQGLRFNLEAEGHSVHVTDNGEDALELLRKSNDFDALVLDVMLPGIDGFEVAHELRGAQNYIPLLMLTARSRPEDILKGFEAGADDYLPKPFNLAILIARVGSLLRRKNWTSGSSKPTASEPAAANIFHIDGKEIDLPNLQIRAGDQIFTLTVMEADLLRYLIQNAGKPVSRKAILEDVWNMKEDTDTRAIDNFVVRLRRYIEPDPSHPQLLLTVRGVGYKIIAKPSR